MKKGSIHAKAYQGIKGDTKLVRGPVTSTTAAVQQMLKSIGRDDMPNVTIDAPKKRAR